jgi:hypothetical protein
MQSLGNATSATRANAHSARILRTFLVFLGLVLWVAGSGFAQETGRITGTVMDQSGAIVANATLTAKNLASDAERTTQSNASGTYALVGLQPGTYQVTVFVPQFQPFTAKIEVTVGGSETLDAKLAVSQSVSEVQVVADTGGVSVNTSTQELSQVVDTQQLSSLPSLTRNPYDFVVLSGNVSNGDNTTDDAASSQNLSSRGVGYSINGQRETGTEILLDGVENISVFSDMIGEQVPLDSVQEYSIVTNNFSAQYGRASGGVVNVTTKSGTNQFHGSAWEYNRLSAYTANTYQNEATGLPKGIYTRNQLGYAVGGPILKDKLFFYQSTEWIHVRSQAQESELIPTPQFLATTAPSVQSYFANYGSTPYPIVNTLTQYQLGLPTPLMQSNGTPVPASTPIFGQVNFTANADAGGDYPQNSYSLMGRLDYNLGENTQMFFRFGQQSQNLFYGTAYYSPYPQYDVGSAVSNDSALYSISHAFSPTLFSNSKVSFNRLDNPNTYNAAEQNVPQLMFGGATAAGLQITFPGLENYMAPGSGGLPYGGPQNTVQVVEDVAWSKGRHEMHFGFQGTYLQMNIAYGAYAQAVEYLQTNIQPALQNMLDGTLQYYEAAVNTQGKYPCVQNPNGSLVSTPSCDVTPPLTAPSLARSDRYKDWAIYAQDSFKATPQLTLNYGIRYEHYGVQHNDNQNLDSNFYYGSGSNIFQQISDGQVYTAPQSPVGQLWRPRWGTVAPRVGFAYDIFGNGQDSVRGGFGISYERNFGNVTFNVIQNPPAYGVLQTYNTPVTNSNLGPFGVAGPAQPLPPLELRNVDQNINVAQTQFWSLALDHQIGKTSVVEISYSGAHGVHLYDIFAANPIGGAQAYLGAPVDCPGTTTECLTRNNAQYAAINVRGSGGSSSYNAVNVKYQTQNLHNTGLTLVANYTFSHSLDDLSSTFSDGSQGGSGYIGNLGYLDPRNPMLDWASSDYDVPNRIVVSPIWQTPWFKSGHNWKSEVAGGWIVDDIFTARSGTPFSAFDFTYNLNGFSGVPRIVPITPVTQHKPGLTTQVGPNEFQINSIPGANDMAPFNTTLGISDFGPFPVTMTGRNSFRGPGAWDTDASLTKKFNLHEGMDLQFRAEAFDLFNHHNLYVNESALSVDNQPAGTPAPYLTPLGIVGPPLPVIAEKGGLNSVALGGNHDERRFGQFALRFEF